jgi:hypothetical protein
VNTVADLPAVLRGDNEYLNLVRSEGWFENPSLSSTPPDRRSELVRQYSWAIPNNEALDAIAELSPIVEIGAGNGYWAMLLRERGAEVAAFDRHPAGPENDFAKRCWSETEHQEIPAALHIYRTLFLCWPSEDEVWPEKALAEFSGPTVAYVGTPEGGCCATPGFFALLERNFERVREIDIPRWYGIRDSLTIWQRRAEAA